VLLGGVVEHDRPAQAPLVGERAVHEHPDVVGLERAQREEQRSGQQRRDDREARILGRGGHEGDPPVLHARQERVLLRLGEAVDLVDEQHGLAAAGRESPSGILDHDAQVLDARGHRRELDEPAARRRRDQVGQRRLARSRGTPEHDRGGCRASRAVVGLDQTAQRGARDQEVILACDLGQGGGSHPDGERGVEGHGRQSVRGGGGGVEQIHAPSVRTMASLTRPAAALRWHPEPCT
jgi:hypothetical protein